MSRMLLAVALAACPAAAQDPAPPRHDPEAPPAGMVIIPAGETIVGTHPGEIERLADRKIQLMHSIAAETPRHTVLVDDFLIDRTEVTNLQWQVYLDATGQEPSADLVQFGWRAPTLPPGKELHPVSGIGMAEIEGYLRWCGKRLPSELEWIRAARGDDDRAYPWGPHWDAKRARSGNTVPQRAAAVGSHPDGASPFGVLDLAGNVAEWVASPYSAYPDYETLRVLRDKSELMLSPDFDRRRRVIKGGCYFDTRESLRIDLRLGWDPGYDVDAGLGFRAARSDPSGAPEALAAGYRRLLSPRLRELSRLDIDDTFARTETLHDTDRGVITGFRCLAFAHMAKERLKESTSRMLRDSVDAPITLGLLVTSEPLAAPKLPPGEYVVAYKKEGESEAHKERRRTERKRRDDAPPRARELPDDVSDPHDWDADVDFPQNEAVLLFLNANDVVVGWTPAPIPQERKPAPLETETRGERDVRIAFSLDTAAKRVPRFELPLTLARSW